LLLFRSRVSLCELLYKGGSRWTLIAQEAPPPSES
jgi:hypothetical protein